MMKEISFQMDEAIIAEFKEIPLFWIQDDKYNLIKPSIQDTLKKYIIDKVNDRRIELVISQTAMATPILKDGDIIIARSP